MGGLTVLIGIWLLVAVVIVHVSLVHVRTSTQLATAVLCGVLWPLVCLAVLFTLLDDEETWS